MRPAPDIIRRGAPSVGVPGIAEDDREGRVTLFVCLKGPSTDLVQND